MGPICINPHDNFRLYATQINSLALHLLEIIVEPQNVRNLSHPVRIRWIKLSNLALFIYITGYLDVRKMSERLVFRTFVGALQIRKIIAH